MASIVTAALDDLVGIGSQLYRRLGRATDIFFLVARIDLAVANVGRIDDRCHAGDNGFAMLQIEIEFIS